MKAQIPPSIFPLLNALFKNPIFSQYFHPVSLGFTFSFSLTNTKLLAHLLLLAMKSRVRSNTFITSKSRPSFYTYLKPGALSKIRYSKIAGKSKQIDAQTLVALRQLKSTSESAFSQINPITDNSIEGFPSFSSRFQNNYPRCLQRKKLIAVMPYFSWTQS